MPHQMSESMRECLAACEECRRACLETFAHCLGMGGDHAAKEHVTLLADCAEICGASVGFLGRGSAVHGAVCGACAEICAACADSCESMAGDDPTMRQCAEACRRCAETCRQMAAA